MRKLVKKLALVLALVLAIGCIAPASAQAAEGVRRSWNFAPGEFKPTLNLTVGESYTLEALDYEAAMDYSIYDVAYYSYNTDALVVSMETGYAEAKAAAENVKIKAVVVNKETGGTASFWGFVDIAEKEVVATATPTATVAPTEAPFALVDVAQIAKDEIVLTFNDDATNVKKTDLEIKYSKVAGSSAKYNGFIKGTPEVDGNQVYVTLYNGLKDEATVYVSYNGGKALSFEASAGDVADIRIVTTEIAVSDEATPIKIELLDDNGIVLDTLDASATDKMPEGAYCEMELIGDVDDDGKEIAYASGCDILFTEMGKEVVAIITYHTGDFDEDGNEIVFDDDAYIASIDTTPIVTKASWSVTNQKVSNSHKASYGAYKLAVGDSGYRLAGKLVLSVPQMNADDKVLTVYTEQVAKDGRNVVPGIDLQSLAYESSDLSVLLVTSEGVIVPVNEGKADIIVKFADYEDEETGEMVEGDVIGVHEVEVLAKRKISTAATSVSSAVTVSTSNLAGDGVTVKVTAKDQHGNAINLKSATWRNKVELVQLTESSKLTNIAIDGYKINATRNVVDADGNNVMIDTDGDGVEDAIQTENVRSKFVSAVADDSASNTVKFTIKGYADGSDVNAGTYRFKVVIDGVSTAAFTVIFKDVKGSAASYALTGGTSKDVKVQKTNSMPGDVTLTAWAYDASKVKIQKVGITGQVDKENEGVTSGSFWYDVTVPSKVDKDEFIAEALTVGSGSPEIKMSLYEAGLKPSETENPIGREVGDYVFTLYIFKNGSYRVAGTATVTIKNGQEGLSATVEKLTIVDDYNDIMDPLTITQNANGDDVFTSAFTATAGTVSGDALISNIIKESYEDTEGYCVSLWDGSTEINAAENGVNTDDTVIPKYEVVAIKGFADGNNKITVTKICVEKTYGEVSNGELIRVEKKIIEISVNAGFTFSEE